MTRRALTAFSVVLLLFLSACSTQQSKNGAEQTDLTIAAVAPTTGKYAEMGNDVLNAVRMAVDERNARGGIDGRKIKVVVEDDKGDATEAVSVARKVSSNQSILGVVGHLNSGTTLAASPIYAEAGMPVVMPVPTNPDITKKGFKNLFRIPITDDKQGASCAAYLVDSLHATKIAIVNNKGTYGLGIARAVETALKARSLNPVAFEAVNADDQDFRPIISKLKRQTPDAVFYGGEYADAGLFIRQSRVQGLKVPIVLGDGAFDSQLIGIAGAAAEGVAVSNIAPMTAPSPEASKFYSTFVAQHGKIVAFAPLGYVATTILLDGVEKAPQKSRAGVLAVLSAPTYSFSSILGVFSFEPNGDSKGQQSFMHLVKDGHFVAAQH